MATTKKSGTAATSKPRSRRKPSHDREQLDLHKETIRDLAPPPGKSDVRGGTAIKPPRGTAGCETVDCLKG